MTDDTTTDDSTDPPRLEGAYSERMSAATTAKAEESQQLQEQQFADARGGAISPPYPPAQLAKLIEVNTTHAKSGFAKARNVAGYGIEIVPHPEVEDPDESQREIAEEFWFSGESDWQVGPMDAERATPADVLEMMWGDYEFIGWFSGEVLTSLDGTPTGLAYIPAPTVRKRKDAPGFVQIRNGNLRYFGAFGDRYTDEDESRSDRRFVDADTGAVGPSVTNPANELLFKRNHTPFVDHYGTPDIIPAIPNIDGDQSAREFNIDFFDGNAVPRLAIIVEGGELTQNSRDDIHKLFRTKLKDNDHRTAILEVNKLLEEKVSDFATSDGEDSPRIRLEPLTVGVDEDASFLEYHDWNEHEILKAHDVPPVVAGTVESGAFSSDAEQQRKQFLETVIKPKQESFTELLYETIHQALGVTDYTITFKTRGVDTRLSDAQVAQTRIQAAQGMMTVNEARAELGLDPLDGTAGEMLMAEVGGMGAPGGGGGGIGQAVEELVDDRVDDVREDLRQDVRTEGRLQSARGDD
ncbi:phage portal protein [Halostella sp. PRR32]|uniref:phage portal protein n=1 Tax=Halostella sp. PRR32 TaxID=3098147 RepID=UPI002B1E5DCA|nr:phage portal protein [Halostella sp. PRR32]